MRSLLLDARYSIRTLLKSPGFALGAVATLALGIGSCVAIFSVINALLIQPLPYADPGRVVFVLGWDLPHDSMRFNVSAADFASWRDANDAFEDSAIYRYRSVALTGVESPERLQGYDVTTNMFSLLGVQPMLGRNFEPGDAESAEGNVVILSHRTWERRFLADRGVIGTSITLNGEPCTVIGVMPAGFEFPQGNFRGDLWLPLRVDAASLADRSRSFSAVAVARVRDGVPLEQAQARMDAIYRNLESDFPDTNTGLGVRLIPFREFLVGPARPALLALLGAVGLLMLIACANVSNLLLARGRRRRREIAVRSALGAGRWRLVRQLCTENVVLSLLACVAGVLLARWMLVGLLAGVPEFYERVLPALTNIGLDRMVLMFAFGLAIVTSIIFGVLPARAAMRINLTHALKDGGQGTAGGHGLRLGKALVACEVALSALLLVGAGLLLRSFENLRDIDTGFDATHVLSGQIDLPRTRYATAADVNGFCDDVLGRVTELPEVEVAAFVNVMPFSTSNSARSIDVQGGEAEAPGSQQRADYRTISPTYFQVMGIPLRDGRAFTAFDGADGEPVAIVNELFVRRFLAGRPPLGSRVRVRTSEDAPWRAVVGVVGDVVHMDFTTPRQPEVYVPLAQSPRAGLTLVARTAGDPMALAGPVRHAVNGADPDLPVYEVQRLADAVSQSLFIQSMTSSMMTGFAIVALVMACVGLYAMISYAVSQRRGEIGVRMALGADRRAVVGLVVRGGLAITIIGLVAGLLLAAVLMQGLASQLHGLTPTDPATYAFVSLLLIAVALLAHVVPARRAARLDPMTALRCE